MGDEIFSVYLTPADYSKLAYAKLDLPASPWKLLDALDKVRLPEGDSLYLEITDYRDFEVLRSSLVCSATNLLELNDLAERLSRLNEVQRIAFEGLVRVDFQKQESITLKRLRDLTESVDCCHVVESVVSDGQLGRFYAENGFVPEVEGMSDAAFELLDFEKVGKMARMGECGVYVPSGISGLGGYVVQHSDLKSAPEITLNQPVEPAYTIHLRLTAHHDMALRYHPDIICVGEMRSAEAYAAQEAARTGHGVLTTIHSNSSQATWRRMVTLCKRKHEMSDDTLMDLVMPA